MKGLYPRGKRRIEIEIASKLAKRKIRRFERHHATVGTDQARQAQSVRANIGSDIEHQRGRFRQFAQGDRGTALEHPAEINRKIYSLRKIQIVSHAVSDDDLLIGSTQKRAPCMNGMIDHASGADLVGSFHQLGSS